MLNAQEIAEMMAAFDVAGDIQLRDIEYRIALAGTWGIPERARILEIGCGQGDMTAVLAAAVGPDGHVTAVDIAGPEYGGPVTLGQSAEHLAKGPLGPRIEFRFNTDLLDPGVDFGPDSFDLIVLAHGAWYFDSITQLEEMLRRILPWSKRFCFAEWDPEPRALEQVAHMLAVLIQGQLGAYQANEDANVRTPFSRKQLSSLLLNAGWEQIEETTVATRSLEDARWEIDNCLGFAAIAVSEGKLPKNFLDQLQTQRDLLVGIVSQGRPVPLDAYAISAIRNP